MPRLAQTGDVLTGTGGGTAALNTNPLPNGAMGSWEFVDAAAIVGQECNEGACDAVLRGTNGDELKRLKIGGVFLTRAGGGRAIVQGVTGVCDTSTPDWPQDRIPLAVSDDGLAADVVYNAPLSVRFTTPGGTQVGSIDGQTTSNNDNFVAHIRHGVFSQATPGGWMLYDVQGMPATNPQPLPYSRWPATAIYTVIPVADPTGTLWVLEQHDLYLTLRMPTETQATIVASWGGQNAQLFHPDCRTINGQFRIIWSANEQESPDALREAAHTVAQLAALPYVTFEAPTTPVTPGQPEPGPDPIPPADQIVTVKPGQRVIIQGVA